MIILTCAVPGTIYGETQGAIIAYWSGRWLIESIDPDDPTHYPAILAKYWSLGEDFAVVEPDIVIRPDVVDALLSCDCEYGCFPYSWLTDVGPALGCTWFRAPFLARYPDAMKEVLGQRISWNQTDVVLMRHILAREYGEQPHVHLPAVEHLNPNKQLLPGASPVPLMEVPHW